MKKFLFTVLALVCFSLSSFANDIEPKSIIEPIPTADVKKASDDKCVLYDFSYSYVEFCGGDAQDGNNYVCHFGHFLMLVC